MSISVNTNSPILTTLQDLVGNGPAAGNLTTDTSASTGSSSVNSAVAIGQNGSTDLSINDVIALSLNRASSIGDAAIGAGQTVSSLLQSLKSDATQAADPSLDPSSRAALNSDYQSVLSQITATVSQAGVDGVNLVDGGGSAGLKLPVSADGGGTLTLSAQNLSLGGPIVSVSAGSNLSTPTAASAALSSVDASLSNLQSAMQTLASQTGQISAHSAIMSSFSGAMRTAATAGANADTDGARLLALQVQQQLSAGQDPIANQSPQLVLSLFR